MKIIYLTILTNFALARNIWDCRNKNNDNHYFGPSLTLYIHDGENYTCVYEGKPLTNKFNAFKVTFKGGSKGKNKVGISGGPNNECIGFYYDGNVGADNAVWHRNYGTPINYHNDGAETITIVFDKRNEYWELFIKHMNIMYGRALAWSTNFGPYYPAVCLSESATVKFEDISDSEAKQIQTQKTKMVYEVTEYREPSFYQNCIYVVTLIAEKFGIVKPSVNILLPTVLNIKIKNSTKSLGRLIYKYETNSQHWFFNRGEDRTSDNCIPNIISLLSATDLNVAFINNGKMVIFQQHYYLENDYAFLAKQK